jgi:hypothetical protein
MNVPIVRILLFSLLVFFTALPGKATDTANDTATLGKELSDKISNQWRCKGEGNVQVELKFQITKEGDAYHLNLSKGFTDPYAIRAALHAVLFAMPLPCTMKEPEHTTVVCTISGSKKNPVVAISFSPSQVGELKEQLSKIPAVKKCSRQTFIYGPMAPRLRALCECLYDFPGSPEIRTEIQTICSCIGLDTKISHDWVGMGRWTDRSVVIMRNPSEEGKKELRSSLAAYLEAWRLKHDKAILYELEDAWTRHAAMEVLSASKADPLLLGNAALLTHQLKTAKEQYNFARKEGRSEAGSILSELENSDISRDLQELQLEDKVVPKKDSTAWESLLYWLPLDTELVLFETKSSKEVGKPGEMSFFGDLILSNTPEDLTRQMNLDAEQLKVNNVFSDVAQVCCLHAARTFKVPKGAFIGIGFSDSVDIMVLPEASKQASRTAMDQLRQKCDQRQAVEGIEVLSFDKAPWSFGLSTFGSKDFVCSPVEGVLVASTDLGYLREVLLRLRTQPNERALPVTNPEWKLVDTTAKTWAVRHFDKAYVPFDNVGMYDIVTAHFDTDEQNPEARSEDVGQEIGFTFHQRDSTVTIHQLSTNPKTLAGLAKTWPKVFNYDGIPHPEKSPEETPVAQTNPKVSINKDVLTVEGTIPKQSMIGIQLYLSLGYFVAI